MANTPNLNLPLIDATATADVPRDMNALANAVDTNVKAALESVTVPDASLTQKGVVQLSNDTNGTRENVAPTEKAVGLVQTNLNTHSADSTSHVRYGIDTGTANAKAVTLSPAPASYVDGMAVAFKNSVQNTGAVTININGLGAKTVLKSNGNALSSGNLKASSIYTLRYNGTSFILQGEGGGGNAQPSDVVTGKTFTNDNGEQMGTREPGKKYATGTVKSSNSQNSFVDVSGNQVQSYYVTVSGLGFAPTRIDIFSGPSGTTFYDAEMNYGSTTPPTSIGTPDLGGIRLTGPAYVNSSGFQLPVKFQSTNYTWKAYGDY